MRNVINPTIEDEAQLVSLVEHLHLVREDERVKLARRIHDELGSLLVSAAMDVGWAERHTDCADLRARLRRTGMCLRSAIDMKRHMIEQLRPSLLDNLGLFETLRWYFRNACQRGQAKCTEKYPSADVVFSPLALSNIFRAIQSLLDCTFLEEDLDSVQLEATNRDGELTIRIEHEHLGHEIVDVSERFHNELKSVAYRLAASKGELSFDRYQRGSAFYVKIPLKDVDHDLRSD